MFFLLEGFSIFKGVVIPPPRIRPPFFWVQNRGGARLGEISFERNRQMFLQHLRIFGIVCSAFTGLSSGQGLPNARCAAGPWCLEGPRRMEPEWHFQIPFSKLAIHDSWHACPNIFHHHRYSFTIVTSIVFYLLVSFHIFFCIFIECAVFERFHGPWTGHHPVGCGKLARWGVFQLVVQHVRPETNLELSKLHRSKLHVTEITLHTEVSSFFYAHQCG